MRFPKIVYKYRDWNIGNHKNILLYNELYLASPKDFNDPFDCRIPPNYIQLTDNEKNEYIKKLSDSGYSEIKSKGKDVAKTIMNLENRVKNTETFQKSFEKALFDKQDKYYGIIAFSVKWNSILMWSHYANSHKGFCVGFKTRKLWETGLFGGIVKVDYDTKFPNIKPQVDRTDTEILEKLKTQTGTKSKEWTYEKEFRFLKNFLPDEPKPFERLINIPDDIISEVVLGINISDEHKEEIIQLCNSKKITVYRAKKKEFEFKIERELIK